mgnify:FL=1
MRGDVQIDSWSAYRRFLTEDLAAYDPSLTAWRPWHAIKYPTLSFQRKLRLAEYWLNRRRGPVSKTIALLLRWRARHIGMKLGFSVPPNVFGPGLSIAHWGTLIVNDRARVGSRCRIHPGAVLAVKDGLATQLGDDCYVGPGAKLIGGIILGDGCVVGANAVVTKSFPAGSVLAGVPARVIRKEARAITSD